METTQPLLPAHQSTDSSYDSHLDHQQTEDCNVIDIDKLIEDSKGNPCCIYRVPHMIRKLNEDAYTPMAVSIGPFHYGDKRLRDMEEYKQVLFDRFKQKAKASLDEMVSIVKNSEEKVRASYSENIKLVSEEFTKLVLVDAAFIIELFTSYYTREIWKDAKLSQPYLQRTILNDLLLLENQLPFFLIEELFNRAFPRDQLPSFYLTIITSLPSFLDLTFRFFHNLNEQKLEPNSDDKIKHFTDLLRLFYLPKKKSGRKYLKREDHLHYNASELQEAGIKFKSTKSKFLFGFSFSRHVLEIPQIFVEDYTEFLFRNMIALEHCHYPLESYIIDYCLAMNCLINSNKDVDVLIHNNIIQNWLGDANEVATLFNGLCKNIPTESCSCEYLELFKRLNKFYDDPCHMGMATLRRDYCDTPWKTVATYVGIIVLILTVTQSIIYISQAII